MGEGRGGQAGWPVDTYVAWRGMLACQHSRPLDRRNWQFPLVILSDTRFHVRNMAYMMRFRNLPGTSQISDFIVGMWPCGCGCGMSRARKIGMTG